MKHKTIYLLLILFFESTSVLAQDFQALLSWNLRPYWLFIEGFEEVFPKTLVKVLPSSVNDRIFFKKTKDQKAWIAVGHRALTFLNQRKTDIPVFAGLILSKKDALKNKNLDIKCGVFLKIPPKVVLPIIKREIRGLLNEKQHIIIGIPYSDEENVNFIKSFIEVGNKLDVKIISIKVDKNWKNEFKILCKNSDLIYFIPDSFLSSEDIIRSLIKISLSERKPVVGYNRFFLKEGAFLVFEIDYKKSGKRLAFLYKQYLRDHSCSWLPATFSVLINEKFKEIFSFKVFK